MISTGRTGDFQFTGFALSAHRNIQKSDVDLIQSIFPLKNMDYTNV